MESIEFARSSALNNIPKKKLQDILLGIEESDDTPQNKHVKLIAVNRYAESNIPIEYWGLSMNKDFHGDPRLLAKYKEYTEDLKKSYTSGSSICFAGNHGVGKTLTVCGILKKCVQKGYSAQYSNLSDIVSVLTQASNEEKYIARKELCVVDFLAIEEFDSRHMSSENASDLYARSLESIFRIRAQNKLPTLMSTNSPNVVESFNGTLKASITSLFSGYIKMFAVLGDDFRKKDK